MHIKILFAAPLLTHTSASEEQASVLNYFYYRTIIFKITILIYERPCILPKSLTLFYNNRGNIVFSSFFSK